MVALTNPRAEVEHSWRKVHLWLNWKAEKSLWYCSGGICWKFTVQMPRKAVHGEVCGWDDKAFGLGPLEVDSRRSRDTWVLLYQLPLLQESGTWGAVCTAEAVSWGCHTAVRILALGKPTHCKSLPLRCRLHYGRKPDCK